MDLSCSAYVSIALGRRYLRRESLSEIDYSALRLHIGTQPSTLKKGWLPVTHTADEVPSERTSYTSSKGFTRGVERILLLLSLVECM